MSTNRNSPCGIHVEKQFSTEYMYIGVTNNSSSTVTCVSLLEFCGIKFFDIVHTSNCVDPLQHVATIQRQDFEGGNNFTAKRCSRKYGMHIHIHIHTFDVFGGEL